MTGKYQVGDKPVRHWRKPTGVLLVSFLIFGGILLLVLKTMN